MSAYTNFEMKNLCNGKEVAPGAHTLISSPPRKRCVEVSIESRLDGTRAALCPFHVRSSYRTEKPDFKAAVATLMAVG